MKTTFGMLKRQILKQIANGDIQRQITNPQTLDEALFSVWFDERMQIECKRMGLYRKRKGK